MTSNKLFYEIIIILLNFIIKVNELLIFIKIFFTIMYIVLKMMRLCDFFYAWKHYLVRNNGPITTNGLRYHCRIFSAVGALSRYCFEFLDIFIIFISWLNKLPLNSWKNGKIPCHDKFDNFQLINLILTIRGIWKVYLIFIYI